MNAVEIIKYLRSENFTVSTDGEFLELSPIEKVTEKLIQRLKRHKPEILKELQNEKTKHLTSQDETKIKAWLFHIGEPEEDHYLVLDKCANDPEALTYFLSQSTVTGDIDKNETANQSKITNYLWRIARDDDTEKILNECENNPATLAKYLRLADTLELSINPYTGMATIRHSDKPSLDSRVQCRDCLHLNWRNQCTKWKGTNPGNARYEPVLDIKRRCDSFMGEINPILLKQEISK